MTHTTTRQAIHHPVQLTFSLHDSSEKQQPRWIYLYWIMLSLVGEELTLWAEGTIVFGKLGFFSVFGLNLSIFMFLWFQ
jgi:hypothetical protein